MLAVALALRSTAAVAWAALLLVAEYGLALRLTHSGIDLYAVVYGALLYAGCELADWSHGLRVPHRRERAVVLLRLAAILAVALVGAAAGALALALAEARSPAGIAATAAGAASAAAAVALIAWRAVARG